MNLLLDAWRLLDGTYRLSPRAHQGRPDRRGILAAGGRRDEESGSWIVPESEVDRLGAQRVFVVVLAGFCCRGPSGVRAREYERSRGMMIRVSCPGCGRRPDPAIGVVWTVPIVETCGEGEEGRLTYEAAFRAEVEG